MRTGEPGDSLEIGHGNVNIFVVASGTISNTDALTGEKMNDEEERESSESVTWLKVKFVSKGGGMSPWMCELMVPNAMAFFRRLVTSGIEVSSSIRVMIKDSTLGMAATTSSYDMALLDTKILVDAIASRDVRSDAIPIRLMRNGSPARYNAMTFEDLSQIRMFMVPKIPPRRDRRSVAFTLSDYKKEDNDESNSPKSTMDDLYWIKREVGLAGIYLHKCQNSVVRPFPHMGLSVRRSSILQDGTLYNSKLIIGTDDSKIGSKCFLSLDPIMKNTPMKISVTELNTISLYVIDFMYAYKRKDGSLHLHLSTIVVGAMVAKPDTNEEDKSLIREDLLSLLSLVKELRKLNTNWKEKLEIEHAVGFMDEKAKSKSQCILVGVDFMCGPDVLDLDMNGKIIGRQLDCIVGGVEHYSGYGTLSYLCFSLGDNVNGPFDIYARAGQYVRWKIGENRDLSVEEQTSLYFKSLSIERPKIWIKSNGDRISDKEKVREHGKPAEISGNWKVPAF
jgi:hypothetical protein